MVCLSLLSFRKRCFNSWQGVRLLPLLGQCCYRVRQHPDLILAHLFPLLEVGQLLSVGLGKLFDESTDVVMTSKGGR
jgi:hypothetical protein